MSVLVVNATELDAHPACLILPEMEREDYERLKEDISGFGLRHPITLYQGKILDGRHRYRACLELGINPVFEEWEGGSSIIEFVLGENLLRRHLNASQKAMVAVKAMEYHRGEARRRQQNAQDHSNLRSLYNEEHERVSAPGALTTSSDVSENDSKPLIVGGGSNVVDFLPAAGKAAASAAKDVGVSARTVEQAVYVKEHGTDGDVADVEAGRASVKAKAQEIKERAKPTPIVSDWITPDRWREMSEQERQAVLTTTTGKKLNKQDNSSIDWAAWSWNPITGCEHDCTYCYARDIANRFYTGLGFAPALHPDRLLIPGNHAGGHKQNNRVFTCSMADLFGAWVPREWVEAVLSVCADSPAFDFLLLTKNPKRLTEFDFPRNCWVGTTTDTQRRMDVAERIFADVSAHVKWVSVEPMLEPILPKDPSSFDWYVIGGATPSSGQPGFVPPAEWVFRLALRAHDAGAKTFIKTNFWDNGRPKEFPSRSTSAPQDSADR